MDAPPLNSDELDELYNWVDQVPLSRPKKNICRDFSDGQLAAEIVNYFLPRLVELHNYPQANSIKQKNYNWSTLNNKVFKKMNFQLSKKDIDQVVNCVPDAIERVLKVIQVKMDRFMMKQNQNHGNEVVVVNEGMKQQKMGQPNSNQDSQMMVEKDQTIQELRETIEVF